MRRRIDETGTKEPTIQREGEDRILVQLPGVDDPEHVKELIGKTAKMTFQLVDANASPPDARNGRRAAGRRAAAGRRRPPTASRRSIMSCSAA